MTHVESTSGSSPAPMTQEAERKGPTSRKQGRKRGAIFLRYRRHFLAALFLVGALVNSPALRSAYLLDDYLHASMVAGVYPTPRGPFDLYNFVSDADRDVLVDRGMLPWWSDPRLTIRFF